MAKPKTKNQSVSQIARARSQADELKQLASEIARHAAKALDPDSSIGTGTMDDASKPFNVESPGGIDPRQRLRSVDYVRPRPHLKHLATEQGA